MERPKQRFTSIKRLVATAALVSFAVGAACAAALDAGKYAEGREDLHVGDKYNTWYDTEDGVRTIDVGKSARTGATTQPSTRCAPNPRRPSSSGRSGAAGGPAGRSSTLENAVRKKIPPHDSPPPRLKKNFPLTNATADENGRCSPAADPRPTAETSTVDRPLPGGFPDRPSPRRTRDAPVPGGPGPVSRSSRRAAS